MNNEQFKPIEDNENNNLMNLPNLKEVTEQTSRNDEIIENLPEWSIEPPIEINRGQK